MKQDRMGWGLGCFLVLAGTMAWANGFRNPPAGGEAFGRVGGKVAQIEDASAVEHNPANLTGIKAAGVMGAVTIINTGTDFHSPMGEARTKDDWKFLPNLFAVLPSTHSDYVFGMGITTPFGQSTVWEKEGVFRYTAPYSAELTVINVNPTLAVKLDDRISVAAGLDVFMSRLDIKQMLPWSQLTGGAVPDGTAHLQGDGAGVGGNAAISYRLTQAQSLALTYRSPVKVDYEGDSDFSGAQIVGLNPASDFDASVEFPTIIGFGYGLDLTKSVRLGADIEWIEFSRYGSLSLDAGNNNPLVNSPAAANPRAPMVIRQNWKDIWSFGLGADWKVSEGLTLRTGYIYLPSPIPEATVAPTLPDADRHVFTLGAGIRRGLNRLDVAYGYSLIPDREVDQNQNPAYNGTYESTSHLMSVSYARSF